jgi:transcriptional regulator of acetoin/glycerol metabolism
VSDPVIHSWMRCLQGGRQPTELPSFDPVTRSRVSAALARHHALLEVAADELTRLDGVLAGTRVKAILTDRNGIVLRSTPATRQDGELLFAGCRAGVDLGEHQMGTAAPGLAAAIRRPCTVQGPEHFFASVQTMYCAAAPIIDARGQVAAVLDLSIQHQHFGFDAISLVKLTATAIENRLLARQSRDLVLLRFQAHPSYLDTPMAGLAGVDLKGRIAWINEAAAGQLGVAAEAARGAPAENVTGLTLSEWLRRSDDSSPRPFCTPAGLHLWAQVRAPQHRHRPEEAPAAQAWSAGSERVDTPGIDAIEATNATSCRVRRPLAATPTPGARHAGVGLGIGEASLASASRQLIAQTLASHGGNISRAARALGVSRGLLYRRLRDTDGSDSEA